MKLPLLFALAWSVVPVVAQSSPAQAAAGDIRHVDFQRYTYTPGCTDTPVTTSGGVFQRESRDDRISFKVMRVSYGDVNGDGQDEALVATVCNTGGSGDFTDAFVFGLVSGKPQLLAKVEGGDRAVDGIHDIAVESGRVVLWLYGDGSRGACCPVFVDRWEYRLAGGKLEQVRRLGRTAVHEDQGQTPPRPIRFNPGTSAASIEDATMTQVTYQLTARAGQTMTVRMQSRKAPTLTVLGNAGEGLATVPAWQSWTGKLPAAGVYRLRVKTDFFVALYTLDVEIH